MNAAEVIRRGIGPLQEELEAYPGLWETFQQCFMNTIETTVKQTPGDTFVITGAFLRKESEVPTAPEHYTRSWFAWANSLFGEWIFRLHEEGKLLQVIHRAAELLTN